MNKKQRQVRQRILNRFTRVLAWTTAARLADEPAYAYPVEEFADPLLTWLDQRFAACCASGKLDLKQLTRDVLQKCVDLLDGN